jgi:hypothetical protein
MISARYLREGLLSLKLQPLSRAYLLAEKKNRLI